MARFHRIEHLSNVVIARDGLDLKQGTGVVTPSGLLHRLLVTQKRRALSEKDAEGRHGDVIHAILDILTGATVWQGGKRLAHAFNDIFESARIHASIDASTRFVVQVTIV